jgi:hypothetical protein
MSPELERLLNALWEQETCEPQDQARWRSNSEPPHCRCLREAGLGLAVPWPLGTTSSAVNGEGVKPQKFHRELDRPC